MEDIQQELLELDERERTLQMELLDVLTDISTPQNSDDEGDEVDELAMPQVREALLEVKACPTRWAPFTQLYQRQEYRDKAERKVRKMKKLIKRRTISEVMLNHEFIAALQRIEQLYPDDGGRQGLNSLVACHHVIYPEA